MRLRHVLVALLAAALTIAAAPAWAGGDGGAKAELDRLFVRLHEVPDGPEARAIEDDIWAAWSKSGDPRTDALLAEGAEAMAQQDADTALARFNMVVALAPGFAEGWNKRATLYYLVDEFDRALKDIERTLVLEPRHFGALSGRALIYRAMGDDKAELAAWRAALKANPHIEGARARVEELATEIEGQGI